MGRWSDISLESFALVAPPVVVHTDVTTRGQWQGAAGGDRAGGIFATYLFVVVQVRTVCRFVALFALVSAGAVASTSVREGEAGGRAYLM